MDMVITAAAVHSTYVIITIKICRKSFLAPHILPGKDALLQRKSLFHTDSVTFWNHFHLVASGMEKLLSQGKQFRPFNHFS